MSTPPPAAPPPVVIEDPDSESKRAFEEPTTISFKTTRRKPATEYLKCLWNLQFFAIIIIPVVFIWIIHFKATGPYEGRAFASLYVVIILGSFYTVDLMPLAAASLVPLFTLPILLAATGQAVMERYCRDANMCVFASSMLALSCVSAGISKRVAYKILMLSKGDLEKIMAYVSMLSGVLSLWMVNVGVMMFMMNVTGEIEKELENSVHLGTLGDQKMNEYKAAELEEESRLLIEHTTTQSDQDVNTDSAQAPQQGKDPQKPGANKTASPNALSPDSISLQKSKESIANQAQQVMRKDGSFQKPSDSEPTEVSKLQLLKEENAKLIKSYSVSLHHAMAIATSVGGLFWPHCSTSSNAALLLWPDSCTSYAAFPMKQTWFKAIDVGMWMSFTAPIIALLLPFTCWYLHFINFVIPRKYSQGEGKPPGNLLDMVAKTPGTRETLKSLFANKAPKTSTFHELGVITVITTAVLLVIFRKPVFLGGWATHMRTHVSDSTIIMLCAIVLFIIPNTGLGMFKGPKDDKEKPAYSGLLGWKLVQGTFPWGLLIFIGAGTALDYGCFISQFTHVMAKHFDRKLLPENQELNLLIFMLFTFTLANFVSSTFAAFFVPKIIMLMKPSKYHPIIMPCIAVSSFAIMLPQGTATLALAHMSTQKLPGWKCFLLGAPLAIVCFVCVYIFGLIYMDAFSKAGGFHPCGRCTAPN